MTKDFFWVIFKHCAVAAKKKFSLEAERNVETVVWKEEVFLPFYLWGLVGHVFFNDRKKEINGPTLSLSFSCCRPVPFVNAGLFATTCPVMLNTMIERNFDRRAYQHTRVGGVYFAAFWQVLAVGQLDTSGGLRHSHFWTPLLLRHLFTLSLAPRWSMEKM